MAAGCRNRAFAQPEKPADFYGERSSIPSALAANYTVLGDYFQAAGIRLQHGRLFDSRDRRESQPVLVINEALARQYFPGKDADRTGNKA